MLNENERSKFLYETKALMPYKRKDMTIDFILKAKALLEQELILDAMYNQMDFKTMDNLTKDNYRQAINSLDFVLNKLSYNAI